MSPSKDGADRTEEFLSRRVNRALRLNSTAGTDSIVALKALVSSGVGVGVLYRDLVAQEPRAGRIKALRIPVDLTVEQFIVYSREKPLSPMGEEFLKLLRNARRQLTEAPLQRTSRSFQRSFKSHVLVLSLLRCVCEAVV